MAKLCFKLIGSLFVFIALCSIFALGGCGSTGTGDGTGTVQIDLTDASTDAYKAIYVTIDEVHVIPAGENDEDANWQTILTPQKTFNLLELVNGVRANLGITELNTGRYAQLRLILGETPDSDVNILGVSHPFANYLIDNVDTSIELKVPSGLQTGIKIVGGFSIASSSSTELILDFDAARSVVQAGDSGKWLLKPTIKVLDTVENLVTGIIDDGTNALEGVLVSAQIYDPSATDVKNSVDVETASVSDEGGSYTLYLQPDIYNIVAVKQGYEPACIEVKATGFMEYIANFSLTSTASSDLGMVFGEVNGLETSEDSASLSFRQSINCGNGSVQIEVLSINVAEGGAYTVTLPAGTYQLVASTYGEFTQEHEVEVFALGTQPLGTLQDITF